MCIAHCHLDRGVAEQLLNRFERRTAHHEVRSEGVPQHVPSDPAQAGLLARAPQGPLADALRQHPPLLVAENQLAAKMPVTLERRQHLVVERDLPRLAVLGRADHAIES